MRTKFLFDLDGTITREETLPRIAEHFGLTDELKTLTEETVAGRVPFDASFSLRVACLGQYPVDEVAQVLADIPLYEGLVAFIRGHEEACAIVTGNIAAWVAGVLGRIGCRAYTSEAVIRDGRVAQLTRILRKESVVRHYQAEGWRVVFVGDGSNDREAMEAADIAIAAGLTHPPAAPLLDVADEVVEEEGVLVGRLEALAAEDGEAGETRMVRKFIRRVPER